MSVMQKIEEMKAAFVAKTRHLVDVQRLFGLAEPLVGFPVQIAIEVERHPLAPAVDHDYVFNPELLAGALRAYAAGESLLLIGEKGTGKTSFVQQLLARLNKPLLTATMSSGTEIADLMGCKTLEGGEVVAADGIVSYGYRHGIPVLLDEFSALRPEVALALNGVIQGDAVVALNHHGFNPEVGAEQLHERGAVLVKHPGFRLFAADNTGGKQATDGRYLATNEQNSSVRSRFTTLEVGYMPPHLEFPLLQKAAGNVPTELVMMVYEFVLSFREAFSMGQAEDTLSLREALRWVRKLSFQHAHGLQNMDRSFHEAIYGSLQPSDQAFAEELWQGLFGSTLTKPTTVLSAKDCLEQFRQMTN